MFTIEYRERVRDHVLGIAASDARVVAGAVVGSLAHGEGDRCSDLDLTFAVAEGVAIAGVLDDWTRRVVGDLDATRLSDVPAGPTIYRVFLLPGCLQLDISFTPAPEFGARGSTFRLLFGRAADPPPLRPPSADDLFGQAVHHAIRARICLERGRVWSAEYWLSALRDESLSLACLRRGLPSRHGRGFDDLPVDVRDAFRGALARSLERDELLRAPRCAVAGLRGETDAAADLAARVEPELRRITADWPEQAEPDPAP